MFFPPDAWYICVVVWYFNEIHTLSLSCRCVENLFFSQQNCQSKTAEWSEIIYSTSSIKTPVSVQGISSTYHPDQAGFPAVHLWQCSKGHSAWATITPNIFSFSIPAFKSAPMFSTPPLSWSCCSGFRWITQGRDLRTCLPHRPDVKRLKTESRTLISVGLWLALLHVCVCASVFD